MVKLFKNLVFLALIFSIVAACGLLYMRNCEWNPVTAAKYATEHAEKKSVSLCARYVRKAIVAGGVPLYYGGDAWSYKYVLTMLNFKQVPKKAERKIGDIVVFQPIGGRKYGHIAIWNGKQWVSDFKQRNIIVHSDYYKEGCKYAIFRR